jgi:hypothetical protein
VDTAAERIYELTVLGFHPEHRVPVTAKLSRKFYEQLGDDVAGELVDWFNAVDLTYQTQLREINDLNWERFKATLQAEIAALRGELRAGLADFRADLRAELTAALSTTSGEQRSEVGKLRTEMAKLHAEMAKLHAEMAKPHAEMAAMRADLLKWMFIYWSGSVVAVGGLITGLRMFGPR